MFIPDKKTRGTVVKESSPRSYVVKTSGGTYRRNHRHLLPLPDDTQRLSESNSTHICREQTEGTNSKQLQLGTYQTKVDAL